MLYSVVVLLPTTYENGKQSGKHLWCEWQIALIIQEQAFIAINHDAFATGFEEHMSGADPERVDRVASPPPPPPPLPQIIIYEY